MNNRQDVMFGREAEAAGCQDDDNATGGNMPGTKTKKAQRSLPLRKVQPGDTLKMRHVRYRVVAAGREKGLIVVDLHETGRPEERAQYIGLPSARVQLEEPAQSTTGTGNTD